MIEKMTVRDFLKNQKEDAHIYMNVGDCLNDGIPFFPGITVTPEGEKEWWDVLGYTVVVSDQIVAVVVCDDDPLVPIRQKVNRADQFFWSLIGLCEADRYINWFAK